MSDDKESPYSPKNHPEPRSDGDIFHTTQKIIPISNLIDVNKPVVLAVGFPGMGLTVDFNKNVLVANQPLSSLSWTLQEGRDSAMGPYYYKIMSQGMYLSADPQIGPQVVLSNTPTHWRIMHHTRLYLLLGLCSNFDNGFDCNPGQGLCIRQGADGYLKLASIPNDGNFDALANWSLFNLM